MAVIAIGNVQGVDKNLYKNIIKGNVRPEHTLDLHGLSRIEAHDLVIEHIEAAYHQGIRLLLIITGKGSPHRNEEEVGVLKRSMPDFLNSHPIANMILFATSAAPRHGGGGAFYVYLRKNR